MTAKAPAESDLTPKDVAEMFLVSPSTVVNWADSGKLAFYRTPGGNRRFKRVDVDRLYAETFGPTDDAA